MTSFLSTVYLKIWSSSFRWGHFALKTLSPTAGRTLPGWPGHGCYCEALIANAAWGGALEFGWTAQLNCSVKKAQSLLALIQVQSWEAHNKLFSRRSRGNEAEARGLLWLQTPAPASSWGWAISPPARRLDSQAQGAQDEWPVKSDSKTVSSLGVNLPLFIGVRL